MNHLALFDEYRPLLFSIAYRILGTVMDAEDILQEAFLRWERVDLDEVESPKAFLSSIVTRLSIDQLRSARVKRERYIGPWLPEPLVTSDREMLTDTAEQAETISMAFMVLLERLSPEERAVFILREVFDYDYAEIADILGKTPENCRQMMSRARKHLGRDKPRNEISYQQQERLVRQFFDTLEDGDVSELQLMLAQDIVHVSDGNGMVGIARKPVSGAEQVVKFYRSIRRMAPASARIEFTEVNGGVGVMILVAEKLFAVFSLEFEGEIIKNSYAVVNPDKLQNLHL